MRFIEIAEGVSVNVDEIQAIETSGKKTIVHIHHKSFETPLPAKSLLQIIEIGNESTKKERIDVKSANAFFQNVGTFAG